jgi:hypothetical protein
MGRMIIRRGLLAVVLWLLPTVSQAQTGAACHIKSGPAGPAAAPTVDVRIAADALLRTSEPLKISWSLVAPVDPGCRSPLYLILSMPDAVRFEGDGFFALPADSDGPFGIAHKRDRMRVFVPLHLGAALAKGSLNVLIYQAGEFVVDWALVEVPKVRTEGTALADFATRNPIILTSERNRTVLTVGTGSPRIVIRDRFPTRKPSSIIAASSGDYELHAYDGFFQVIERRTGALVLDRDGWQPGFSPTGRFVAAFRGRDARAASRIEILDLVSGELIVQGELRNGGDVAVAWARRDAFVVIAKGEWSDVELHQTVVRNRTFATNQLASGRFNPGTGSAVRLDLENALMQFCCETLDSSSQSARSLVLPDRITSIYERATADEFDKAIARASEQVQALVASHTLLKKPKLVEHVDLARRWDLGEKLGFTHIQENTESGDLPEVRKLLLARPRAVAVAADAKAPLRGRTINTRGAMPVTTTSPASSSRNAFQELEGHGVATIRLERGLLFDGAARLAELEARAKSEKAQAGNRVLAEALRIRQALLAEVPAAERHFLKNDDPDGDYNCYDDTFKDPDITDISQLSQAWQFTVGQRPVRILYTLCYTGTTGSGPAIARLFLFRQPSPDDARSLTSAGCSRKNSRTCRRASSIAVPSAWRWAGSASSLPGRRRPARSPSSISSRARSPRWSAARSRPTTSMRCGCRATAGSSSNPTRAGGSSSTTCARAAGCSAATGSTTRP